MESSDDTWTVTPPAGVHLDVPSTDNSVSIGNAYGEQSFNNEPVGIGALYVQHRTLLLYVAVSKFHVPEADAEALIQEVFLLFLQSKTKVENVRGWLVAAICNASRHYWRRENANTEPSIATPEDDSEFATQFTSTMKMQVTMQTALSYLQPRCREALQLHYYEGRSAAEVAGIMNTTDRYAGKLIHNCLRRVREIYMSIRSESEKDAK